MTAMNRYLVGVLSVIAVGVVTIAYMLVASNVSSGAVQSMGMPAYYAATAPLAERHVAAMPVTYAATEPMVVRTVPRAEMVRTVDMEQAPRRVVTRRVSRESRDWEDRNSGRDWKKTAMIIGGTTAASAGLGGIFGGKKGALIGAAIGGGASTIYETTRR